MELKEEYKQSELGVIPDDWDVVPISTLLEKGARITYGVVQPGKHLDSGVLFVRGGDIFAGKIDIQNLRRIPHEISNNYKRTILHGGEILISLVGYPGEAAIVPDSLAGANIARQAALIRLNKEKSISAPYVCSFLLSETGKRLLLNETFGSAQQVINLKDINKLVILLPREEAEQEAIAGALSDADDYIDSLQRLIAKKRLIKQGTTQDLLTGKRRLPGFSGQWQEITLREIGSTFGGLTGKTKADFGDGNAQYIPFMNVMSNVVISSEDLGRVRVLPAESQNQVLRGDLLLNGSSETPEEVAMCSVITEYIPDLYLNSFCFGFRLNAKHKANGLYLAYYLRSNVGRELIKSLAQGSTRYNLSKIALLKLELKLPSLPEQLAISNTLSDMELAIDALEVKLVKVLKIKQGMMQELLTGRIRLV